MSVVMYYDLNESATKKNTEKERQPNSHTYIIYNLMALCLCVRNINHCIYVMRTRHTENEWESERMKEIAKVRFANKNEMYIDLCCPYLTYTFAAPSTCNIETVQLPNHQVIYLFCVFCASHTKTTNKKKFCICT